MQITTKFEIGDSVVFLHHNSFTRREVTRIEIEASKQCLNPSESSVLIKYYFANLESESGYSAPYKYEAEIAKTKEELAAEARES